MFVLLNKTKILIKKFKKNYFILSDCSMLTKIISNAFLKKFELDTFSKSSEAWQNFVDVEKFKNFNLTKNFIKFTEK